MYMKNLPARILIPTSLALIGLAAIALWVGMGTPLGFEARLAGTDRDTANIATAKPALPLIGKLAAGDGKAADIPGNWPRFRGETFDAIAHDPIPLARAWPTAGPKRLWSIDVGEGHAAAVVRHGRVYVMDYDRQNELDVLRCLSLADGKEIWRFSYPVKIKRNHGMSRTIPAVSDKYVVAIGPKCHVCCLDAKTGKCHWLLDMVERFGATVPVWYAGQCAMIDGQRAILAPGGTGNKTGGTDSARTADSNSLVLALDCTTGDVVWKSPNPRRWTMTHVSIMPMEFAGKKTYVYCGRGGVAGISAEDGRLLWDTTAWKIGIATVPSPLVLPGGKIFCCGGYNSGAVMLQLLEEGGRIAVKTLARFKPKQFGSTQQTPILFQGHIYGVREKDKRLVCMDLDGKELWKSPGKNKFGLGPYMIAQGMIYLLDDSGLMTLAEASPQAYKQLARAQVLHGHDAWGPMAMVDGRLIVRDLTQMTCLDVAQSRSQSRSQSEKPEGK